MKRGDEGFSQVGQDTDIFLSADTGRDRYAGPTGSHTF